MQVNFPSVTKTQSILTAGMILVLAIIFLPTPGTADVFDWLDWGSSVYKHGLIDGYAINNHEHPPLFYAILYCAMAIADITGVAPFYGLKTTFLMALLASTIVIYFWSQRNIEKTLMFFVPLAYSCMTLSYMDIYFTPFFLLSVYYINENKPTPATIFFTFACLIKYPPLIISPFFIIYAYSHFREISSNTIQNIKKLSISVFFPAFLMIFITFLIFGNELFASFLRCFDHNCLSCGAFNFNRVFSIFLYITETHQGILSALTGTVNPLLPYQASSITIFFTRFGIFAIFYSLTLLIFIFRKKDTVTLLIFCILGHFSYFMFSKGVHENHLYLSMLLAMCLAIIEKKYLVLALNIILISSMNMFAIYGINGMTFDLWWTKDYYNGEIESLRWLNAGYPFDKTMILSIFNILYFFALWLTCIASKQHKQQRISR